MGKLHPVFNTQSPPEPTFTQHSLVGSFVADEAFNSAVSRMCEDVDFIYRRLGSLEDNHPARQELEDEIVARMAAAWPEREEQPKDLSSLLEQTASLYQSASQAISEASIRGGLGGAAGGAAVTIGISLTGILGAINPMLGVAGGALGGAYLSARHGSIKQANDQIQDMIEVAGAIHLARQDFQLTWNQKVGDEGRDLEVDDQQLEV